MNSIELTRELLYRGILSKNAAISTLRAREQLIKQAMRNEANALWRNLEKVAGVLDAIGLTGKKPGFFDRLGSGGFSGGGSPGWGDVGSNLLKMLGIATLSAGATAGVGALLKHRRDKSLQDDIQNSYTAMFEEFPRLKEMDQGKVQTYFGVLAKYAPSLAADATVAGSFVTDKATMGQIDNATVKSLAETQHRIDEMHESRSPFSQHLDRGLIMAQKAMTGGGGPGGGGGK